MVSSQRVGDYLLQAVLGQGGAATVYRAKNLQNEQEVAVKIIHSHFAEDREAVVRFQREGWTASKLRHPHIVPVLDYGQEGLHYYIVMKLLPGQTLANITGQPLTFDYVAATTQSIADALFYTHQLGVVHRDVKPNNILLNSEYQPLLTDFGIARFLHAKATITKKGLAVGTPDYMSPEQVSASMVDGRTDQYSLGIIVYQMLTGVKPFHASTIVQTMTAHLHQPMPDPREFRPDLPEAVVAVLEQALAKEPTQRYPTVKAFAEALETALKSGSLNHE